KTYLKPDQGKCLYYYFYFVDEELGLCYLRVPTWCPFRLQFYFNGHNWLASQLKKKGISFMLRDNAFIEIADREKAQKLADKFDPASLHRRLDRLAATYCPVAELSGRLITGLWCKSSTQPTLCSNTRAISRQSISR